MKRTLKVLLGAAALAMIGVSTATAQTGSLLGKNLFLFDGGTGTALNQIQLIAPADANLLSNWTMTLPPDAGGTNYVLVNTDGAGTTEWQDGLSLFWGVEGNCGTIVPWDPNTLTGNYIGTCGAFDLDIRSGGTQTNFWFNNMLYPVLTISETGKTMLLVEDGNEGLVIGGNGPNGPDAGIVLDCAFPPTVGMEVNALATGILMPTCATAPLVGISIEAQTTGLEITNTPTALYIAGATTALDVTGTTALDATGSIYLHSIAIDASDTRILSIDDVTGLVSYRTLAATGTIVTTPAGGTVNTLPKWSPSGTELSNSNITDNGTVISATASNVINLNTTGNGSTQIGSLGATGTATLYGQNIYLNTGAVGSDIYMSGLEQDETDTRIVTQDAGTGEISYRSISGTGSVVTGSGTPNQLTRWGATTGTLVDASLSDNGTGVLARAGDINLNPGTGNTLLTNGDLTVAEGLTVTTGGATVTGTTTLNTVGIDNTTVKLLGLNGSNQVIYRDVPATGTIATGTGTANRMTRWATATTLGNGQITDDGTNDMQFLNDVNAGNFTIQNIGAAGTDFSATGGLTLADNLTVSSGGATVTGTATLNTVANDNTTVKLLGLNGSNQVIYRDVPATGTVVTGTGTLNRQTRWTSTNTLGDAQITDDGTNDMQLLNDVNAGNFTIQNIGAAGTDFSATGGLTLADNLTVSSGGATVTGTATLNTVANDNTTVKLLGLNGSNQVIYRDVAATGTITTGTGTANRMTRWVTATTLGNGQITDDGTNDMQFLNDVNAGNFTIQNIGNAGTDFSATGGLTLADNLTVTAGGATITGTTLVNNTGAATTTIGNSGVGTITNLNSPIINAPNLPATGVVTDEFVVTDGTILRTATVATMIGGTPWVVGGNLIAPSSGIIGIKTASAVDLEFFVNNVQAMTIDDATQLVGVNKDLSVFENTKLGDENADNTDIWGGLNVNQTATAALTVNINASAFAHTTTIGSSTGSNTTNLNSPVVNAPNLPTGAVGNALITTDGTQLFETTPTQLFGGMPWVRGGNAGALSGILGTTDAVDVDLTANAIAHVNLNTSDQSTEINTVATGDVTIGANTVNSVVVNSDDVRMPFLPNDVSTSTWILTYNNATGAIEKKDLGTPIAKTKAASAPISGAPPVRYFKITDTFVTTTSTIVVTLQDGSDVNDYTVTIPATVPVSVDPLTPPGINNGSFWVRLSGVMSAGATKVVHYTVTKP